MKRNLTYIIITIIIYIGLKQSKGCENQRYTFPLESMIPGKLDSTGEHCTKTQKTKALSKTSTLATATARSPRLPVLKNRQTPVI